MENAPVPVKLAGYGALALGGLLAFNVIGIPAALGIGAVYAAGLFAWQRHKDSVNKQNVQDTYARNAEEKGYHHEREKVKDDSLLHRIQGASDLPARAKYIEQHFEAKPMTLDEYRDRNNTTSKGLGLGALVGVGAALVIGAAATPVAALLGISAATWAVVGGAMSGLTALGVYNARTTGHYEKYLDKVARDAKAAQAAERERRQQAEMEYADSHPQTGAHVARLEAERRRQAMQGSARE
jgi:hypothetical protein